jgi:hypothetical protein
MKRDMELIRRILLETEDMPFWKGKTTDPNIQHIEAMPFWKSESAGPNIRQIENHRNPEGFLNLGKYLGIEDHSA